MLYGSGGSAAGVMLLSPMCGKRPVATPYSGQVLLSLLHRNATDAGGFSGQVPSGSQTAIVCYRDAFLNRMPGV